VRSAVSAATVVLVILAAMGVADAGVQPQTLSRHSSGSKATRRCRTSYGIVHALQRDARSGSRVFDRIAIRNAARAATRMFHLRIHSPNRKSALQAIEMRNSLRRVVHVARLHHGRRSSADRQVRRALHRYGVASLQFLRQLSRACHRHSNRASPRVAAVASEALYSEQEGHLGVNTFTNYRNASGLGTRIEPGAWVQVSCKVYDPYIQSVNPDGYWYRIASAPWSDAYYSPANTFMNGDPWGGSLYPQHGFRRSRLRVRADAGYAHGHLGPGSRCARRIQVCGDRRTLRREQQRQRELSR
jgi:hypothetical protein